jgi:hypothetical protein
MLLDAVDPARSSQASLAGEVTCSENAAGSQEEAAEVSATARKRDSS